MTPAELIAFEEEVAVAYNAGRIRAPIHLAGGNEQQLIDIFRDIRPEDWVFSTWRSHYHALLKGVPREQLTVDILAGKSITLAYPEHRFLASAIVAGCVPIAMGAAWQIKRAGGTERVWCFIGDMAARTGAYQESYRYAKAHNLPVYYVVEDNGKSVNTPTAEVWGDPRVVFGEAEFTCYRHYRYQLPHQHSGTGVRVNFW